MLIDFPLDEAAAAGGRLEVEGGALIFGAAPPELAHGVGAGPGPGVPVGALAENSFGALAENSFGALAENSFGALAESKQSAFHVGEERLPGQLAQLGQCPRHQCR